MPSALAPAPARPGRRPPRALALVRDPAPDEVGSEIDWSAWRVEWDDDVGQSIEHQCVVDVLASSLRVRLRELGRETTYVGVDQFFAWVPHEPKVRVSPDVYTLPAGLPQPIPAMIETWRPGHRPPDFAVEVVSDDWKKDYDEGPAKYALLGASELAVFDPEAARGEARAPRVALQVYRRTEDGAFVRIHAGSGPIRAETIDSWLIVTDASVPARLLRLARGAGPADVVPTESELADQHARRADALAVELAALRGERDRSNGG